MKTHILDDVLSEAQDLQEQLRRHQMESEVFDDENALLTAARGANEAAFAIDIDLGHGRRVKGIDVIRKLDDLRKTSESRHFYIAALTSHPEFEGKASEAGADYFRLKDNTRSEALELTTRINHKESLWRQAQAADAHRELARYEYGELQRQLSREGDASVLAAARTIKRALSLPLTNSVEAAILSGLSRALKQVLDGAVSFDEIRTWCLGAIPILKSDSSTIEGAVRWLDQVPPGRTLVTLFVDEPRDDDLLRLFDE